MKPDDFKYILPADKIAIYPLPQRDRSKLLVYNNKKISHKTFVSLPDQLPENAFLFFNDTKVIPARLHFTKETGGAIEIFLLHPVLPSSLLIQTMQSMQSCTWQCTIGNVKRWPEHTSLNLKINEHTLQARLVDKKQGLVEFTWDTDQTFGSILADAGEMPLPPYIGRKAERLDQERYQTIYSMAEGAVAAPTAGLHFTEEVLHALDKKHIGHDFVTLHVSAGTFQPIKTEHADQHIMHQEQIIISRTNIENLSGSGKLVTAVGTTSLRTLESLYWFGTKLRIDPESEFLISQSDAYTLAPQPSAHDAVVAVGEYMDRKQLKLLTGETSIFIRPGYQFRICKGLITNFHQPASTLILLVAAFVGEDWRMIYEEALKNDYRFLSYGDSSLLIPSE